MGHTGVSLLSKQRNENKRHAFWRLFNKLLLTSVLVGIAAIVGGIIVLPLVMNWTLGAKYGNFWLIFTLLLASCLTGAQRIAGRATQACGNYFAYTMFDVIMFLVSTAASLVLVKQFGIVGAGAAISIAFAVGLSVTLFHTYRLLWPEEAESESPLSEGSTARMAP